MGDTRIEWTDKSWSPVTGCTACSEGCTNCYARRMANRLRGRFGYPNDDPFAVTLHPDRLDEPLRWKKPRRIFVCSMSDLFHDRVPPEFRRKVLDACWASPQHQFLFLTKRPKTMRACLEARHGYPWPWPNAWFGVTVCNQAEADEKIPVLLATPAAKRFVSVEPMLGPVDLSVYLGPPLDSVIAGTETGPRARPMDIAWARDLKNQCVEAGVSFFLKSALIDGKLVRLPELDGRQWAERQEVR